MKGTKHFLRRGWANLLKADSTGPPALALAVPESAEGPKRTMARLRLADALTEAEQMGERHRQNSLKCGRSIGPKESLDLSFITVTGEVQLTEPEDQWIKTRSAPLLIRKDIDTDS